MSVCMSRLAAIVMDVLSEGSMDAGTVALIHLSWMESLMCWIELEVAGMRLVMELDWD